MNELIMDNPVQAMQQGMMGAQKIQQGNDEHQSAQINQQLKLAEIADQNYKTQVMKTTALGEDAYSQGQDSDAWKNFKKNNGGIAAQLQDSHALMDSKKALLQLSAIKAHGTAVGSTLLPIRTVADYNANYPAIAKLINDNQLAPGLKAPTPDSFKSDQEVSDWVDDMNGKTTHGIKMASSSGKYIQDRIELIRQHGADSPEVKQLDSDHQAYLDNQKRAHMPKDSMTGVIPHSASLAITADIEKNHPELEKADQQAMIAKAGAHYITRIKLGVPTDSALTMALEDAKAGITTDKGIFSSSYSYDSSKVPDVAGTSTKASSTNWKVGDMVDVKGAGKLKVTKIENGHAYVMHNGKERPIN